MDRIIDIAFRTALVTVALALVAIYAGLLHSNVQAATETPPGFWIAHAVFFVPVAAIVAASIRKAIIGEDD